MHSRVRARTLIRLLSRGGLLEPLVGLNGRTVNGLELDVHLRVNDTVQVYCGLTGVLNVRRNNNGTVSVSAHRTYSMQDCASTILRRWHTHEVDEFRRALDTYLGSVKVNKRHTAGEGAVQTLWSRLTHPWIPFDREAVPGYRSLKESSEARRFAKVESARTELEDIAESYQWAQPPTAGRKLDQFAVYPKGQLVLVELKDTSGGTASVFYTPIQLLHYVWEWHNALQSVRSGLQDLIDTRVELGMTPNPPRLTGGIRAAV